MVPRTRLSSIGLRVRSGAAPRPLRFLFPLFMASLLAGCAVGPDFKPPAPPDGGDSYTPTALPAQTASAPGPAGQAQRFVPGQDIPGQWWSLFQSPALDQLVRDALKRSPSLASAQAALLSGGRAPMIGCHSVMERPEPVSRVSPPMVSIAMITSATASSHSPTALRLFQKSVFMTAF